MRKQEFLRALKKKLYCLPKQELNERLNFYGEMIDDLVEEGLTEEQATSRIGGVDEIALQVKEESACGKSEKTRKRLSPWELVVIIIGSPVWLPLLLAGFTVVLALYIVIWSLIAVVWAVELPFFLLSFISKYLFIFCKKTTKCTFKFTKSSSKRLFGLFARRS